MLPATTTGGCPALAGQPATPAPVADPLVFNPLDSSQNLCTHPPCPTGQIYDCICMICHGRCQSGWFWDDSICGCAPI
ncbi:MAG TPA: hypothetical protein VFC23_12030 [Thermoanaerobaculia bacterium]|nr:hypothetical protein [Thermoanaerobaculia bacterium]